MAEIIKTISKLTVSGDGRSAENWSSYKAQLQNALSAKEVQGIFLDDVLLNTNAGKVLTNPGAHAEAPALTAYSTWARANRVTIAYITGTLPELLHEECAQHALAHELWTYLDKRFAGQTLVSTAALWSRLFLIKLDDYSGVSAFLTAITKAELEIKRGKVDIPPSLLAGVILNGMGNRFPTTKELMLTLPPEQQTKEVFGERLLNAEKTAKVCGDLEIMSANAATTPTRDPRGNGCGYVRKYQHRGFNARPGDKCNKGRHPRHGCWMMLDDKFLEDNPGKTPRDLPNRLEELNRLKEAGMKRANANVATPPAESVDATAAAVTLSKTFFDYTGAVGEEVKTQSTFASTVPSPIVAAAVKLTLDSGASDSCFKEKIGYKQQVHPVQVHGAGKGMITTAHGTSTIPCPALPSKQITGIYSPDFRYNLVSLNKLQGQGVEVVFPAGGNTAECKDPSTGKVLMTFKQASNGLYETSLPCSASARTAAVATTCACKGSSLAHPTVLLHHRLGHISQGYLRTLITCKSIRGLPRTYMPVPAPLHTSCLPCIEAKTQAQPHPPQRTRAERVLEKVHCDLVGPYPVAGLKGEQYRLTIVDDHSRFGWVFPLHTKDQAKFAIINWILQVENQSGKRLKHFHADRGGEFLNNTLLQHLTSKGVTFSFSNPDSPQQNGVAEARNKASGRILLALLLQSEAPHSLWTHAVQHANYINNLYPHHLLGGKTPFEAWHGKQPSMDRLRVWGCTGHVLLNKTERRRSGGCYDA